MTCEDITPGSIVVIRNDEYFLDNISGKVTGWYELPDDITADLFYENPIGIYLGLWTKPRSKYNLSKWHEVLIGSRIYLFRLEQIKPLCQTIFTPEDSLSIL